MTALVSTMTPEQLDAKRARARAYNVRHRERIRAKAKERVINGTTRLAVEQAIARGDRVKDLMKHLNVSYETYRLVRDDLEQTHLSPDGCVS